MKNERTHDWDMNDNWVEHTWKMNERMHETKRMKHDCTIHEQVNEHWLDNGWTTERSNNWKMFEQMNETLMKHEWTHKWKLNEQWLHTAWTWLKQKWTWTKHEWTMVEQIMTHKWHMNENDCTINGQQNDQINEQLLNNEWNWLNNEWKYKWKHERTTEWEVNDT